MKRFTILGGGWLGIDLAKFLQDKYQIKISSRTKDKIPFYENLGLEAYLLNEENTDSLSSLLECDYLFINFPPSKFVNYLNFLDTIYSHKKIDLIEKIIFVSSTSIYPKEDGVYNETTNINNPSSKIVYEAEKFIKKQTNTILRCSAIIGEGRIAGKRLSKKELKDSNSKINYIYKKDIILATDFIIENDLNGIFNLSVSHHPTKKEIYTKNALKHSFEPPIFLDEFKKDRIINGSKIEDLGFDYKYKFD